MLSPSDRAVVARDAALPGLATVLDVAAAAALVSRLLPAPPAGTPQLTYTRYKPGASCLVALRFDGSGAPEFITLKAVSRDADAKWAKYRDSSRVVADEATRIAIRRFPVDGELSGPRWLFDPARRTEALAALQLPLATALDVITYKPERRAVLRAHADGVPLAVLKCHDEAGFAGALSAHEALAQHPGLPVRAATAWHARRRVIVTPWIEGRMLDVVTDPLALVTAAGAALAAVHDSGMVVRDGGSDAAAERALHHVAQAVAGWSPALREPLRVAVGRLSSHRAEPAPEPVPVHGDFYAKQVLVQDARVWLLDFDECGMGDPHVDLANFLAHVERDVLRRVCDATRAAAVAGALLDGYRRSRPVDGRRLAWRTAEALLRLAPHPFRHRDAAWPVLTERLVQRAQGLLDGIPARVRARHVTPARARALRAWSRVATDDALAFAAALAEPDVAERILAAGGPGATGAPVEVRHTTLLRHKPGRRCLVAMDVVHAGADDRWLGKVRARGLDTRGAHLHRRLWDTQARAIIAEPLGTVPALHMTLQRAVPGISLEEALRRGRDPVRLADDVARALCTLHGVDVDPARAWALDDELSLLHARLASLAEAVPRHAPAVDVLRDSLAAIASPLGHRRHRALVHRDLYHDQVLVHGDRCTLVDLDLVAHGDPALDVGNVVGHLVELQWRGAMDAPVVAQFSTAFVEAMAHGSAGVASEEAAARYALLTLARLVEIATRHASRARFVAAHLARLQHCITQARGAPRLAWLLEATWAAA